MSDHHQGQCACGHVKYRMTSDPMFVHCCHCKSCQRELGTAFAINAMVEADRVELLSGAPVLVDVPSDSGKGQKIYRCPKCEIAVWSKYALDGGIGDKVYFVRVGTLDEPGRLPPDIHIFTKSKLPWVVIPEGALAVDVYYSRSAMWPEESLKRRAALSDES